MKQRRFKNVQNGFTAMIAVILISSGIIALAFVVLAHSVTYADSVSKREYRIRARLNVEACIESLKLMAQKNPFLSGTIQLKEFGCEGSVENDFAGIVTINATTTVGGVTASK